MYVLLKRFTQDVKVRFLYHTLLVNDRLDTSHNYGWTDTGSYLSVLHVISERG